MFQQQPPLYFRDSFGDEFIDIQDYIIEMATVCPPHSVRIKFFFFNFRIKIKLILWNLTENTVEYTKKMCAI